MNRLNLMAEESEPFDVPPAQPSPAHTDHLECEGARINRKLEHIDSTLTALDTTLGVVAILLKLLGTHGVSVKAEKVQNGERAEIIRKGDYVDIRLKSAIRT